jgi:tetratricopeptide (TPR) repeat protein
VEFVDVWAWFNRPLRAIGGGSQMATLRRLVEQHHTHWQILETETDRALAFFQQARETATQINAPCYAIFFWLWCCETYIHYYADLDQALDIATKIVVEARKPQYQNCPSLCWAYRSLADVYSIVDPVGYADKIRETLDFIEANIPIDFDTYCLLEYRRAIVSFALDDPSKAREFALSYLGRCESSNFRKVDAYILLCRFSYALGDFDATQQYAILTEQHANRRNRINSLVEAWAWRALIAQKKGQLDIARQFYRKASAKFAEYDFQLWLTYGTIMSDYYVLSEQPAKAIDMARRTLSATKGSGRRLETCKCHLQLCLTLARLEMPYGVELADARAAATMLIDPSTYLQKLDRIQHGDFSVY